GQEPGSTWSFSGTWAWAYHPPSVFHRSAGHVLRDKDVGRPMGHTSGTPQELIHAWRSSHPLQGVSTSLANTWPPTRQCGKNRASIWMTTSPARLVRVPPGASARALLREVAGKNCANVPVKGSQRTCGARPLP